MWSGFPRLATNRLNDARNADVVRSVTTSRCNALVLKHTNIAIQHLYDFEPRLFQDLISIGPAKSIPTYRKTEPGLSLQEGRLPICC